MPHYFSFKRFFKCTVTLAGVTCSSLAFAGGFQLWEQDSSDLGDYHAGAAAEADSAGTEFYNPAGMTRLKHQQVSAGAAYIDLNVAYTGSVLVPTTKANHVHGDTENIVPNFHYVYPFAKHWAFGFGETTPFGLSTQYPDTSPINAAATKTVLKTINLNPSLAYQINNVLSVGVGFDVLYGRAVYDADFFAPIKDHLSGWSYGYNAGFLSQITPHTRLGLSYRSAIMLTAKGASTSGQFKSTVSADFPLPATTMLSIYHDFNQHFSGMVSVFYTQWSVFKKLELKNISLPTGIATQTVQENYRNTWNVAIGGKYIINHYVSVEAGVGHDQTPTRVDYRDIRLPDNNHYVASLGVNVHPLKTLTCSLGYAHLFVPKTTINNSKSGATVTTIGTTVGTVNIVGVQVIWDI